jgi:hypothetical protein
MKCVDRSKTLEELEKQVWPRNDFGSHVVQESQRLRKVPIGLLSVEDLRLLIGQKFGLQFLVPLAIEHLADNPLVSGNYYPGDLMSVVLAIPDEYWSAHPELNNQLVEIGLEVSNLYETIAEQLLPPLKRFQFR